MEDCGSSLATGIKNIAKLKEFINKWQLATLGNKPKNNEQSKKSTHDGIPPAISKRLGSSYAYCDSDEESCYGPEPPFDVPKGYLAVYVGSELRRFIIPTNYLSDPLFKLLLKKVEEEFGFDYSGGLTIPCEIETFKYLLQCMENHQKVFDESNTHNTGETHCHVEECGVMDN